MTFVIGTVMHADIYTRFLQDTEPWIYICLTFYTPFQKGTASAAYNVGLTPHMLAAKSIMGEIKGFISVLKWQTSLLSGVRARSVTVKDDRIPRVTAKYRSVQYNTGFRALTLNNVFF